MAGWPWAVVENGLMLSVRLTPRGGSDRLEGIERLANGRIVVKARVRAIAEDGKANDALLALVARGAALPASRVTLAAGGASRLKTLYCQGDSARIAHALQTTLGLAASSDERAALDAIGPARPIKARRCGGRMR